MANDLPQQNGATKQQTTPPQSTGGVSPVPTAPVSNQPLDAGGLKKLEAEAERLRNELAHLNETLQAAHESAPSVQTPPQPTPQPTPQSQTLAPTLAQAPIESSIEAPTPPQQEEESRKAEPPPLVGMVPLQKIQADAAAATSEKVNESAAPESDAASESAIKTATKEGGNLAALRARVLEESTHRPDTGKEDGVRDMLDIHQAKPAVSPSPAPLKDAAETPVPINKNPQTQSEAKPEAALQPNPEPKNLEATPRVGILNRPQIHIETEEKPANQPVVNAQATPVTQPQTKTELEVELPQPPVTVPQPAQPTTKEGAMPEGTIIEQHVVDHSKDGAENKPGLARSFFDRLQSISKKQRAQTEPTQTTAQVATPAAAPTSTQAQMINETPAPIQAPAPVAPAVTNLTKPVVPETAPEVIPGIIMPKPQQPVSPTPQPQQESIVAQPKPLAEDDITIIPGVDEKGEQQSAQSIDALLAKAVANNAPQTATQASGTAPVAAQPTTEAPTSTQTIKPNFYTSPTLRPVRTFKDDIEQTVHHKKTSLVNVIAAEEERKSAAAALEQKAAAPSAPRSMSALLKVGISGLLLGIGITSVLFFLSTMNLAPQTVPVSGIPEYIFTEVQQQSDLTDMSRRDIMTTLISGKESLNLTLGTIANVYLTITEDLGEIEQPRLMSTTEFLTAIDAQTPEILPRALESTMMFGVHAFDGNQPFLIFKTNFFEQAFAGMLMWEEKINADLAPLFGAIYIPRFPTPQTTPDSSTTTSTTTTPTPAITGPTTDDILFAQPFVDEVIRNKEARVLKDETGKIILMYAFPDANTLVITTNEHTFAEIMTRLTSRRF